MITQILGGNLLGHDNAPRVYDELPLIQRSAAAFPYRL